MNYMTSIEVAQLKTFDPSKVEFRYAGTGIADIDYIKNRIDVVKRVYEIIGEILNKTTRRIRANNEETFKLARTGKISANDALKICNKYRNKAYQEYTYKVKRIKRAVNIYHQDLFIV